MDAATLLSTLKAAGFTITAVNHVLEVRPASRLTAEWRSALRVHKPQLLALLAHTVEAADTEAGTRSADSPSQALHECWSAEVARELIGAVLRRVAAARDYTRASLRPVREALGLAEHPRTIDAACRTQDLTALRDAISDYEAAAAPIFAAWRVSRERRSGVCEWHPCPGCQTLLLADEPVGDACEALVNEQPDIATRAAPRGEAWRGPLSQGYRCCAEC